MPKSLFWSLFFFGACNGGWSLMTSMSFNPVTPLPFVSDCTCTCKTSAAILKLLGISNGLAFGRGLAACHPRQSESRRHSTDNRSTGIRISTSHHILRSFPVHLHSTLKLRHCFCLVAPSVCLATRQPRTTRGQRSIRSNPLHNTQTPSQSPTVAEGTVYLLVQYVCG